MRASPLILAAILIALACPGAAGATGGIGLRTDGTAGSQLSDGLLLLATAPGGTAGGHVLVSNTGDETVTLHVDPVDGRTGKTSGAVFADRGDALRGAGGWLALSTRELTVGPGQERRIDFTVRVPSGAARGDHMAGVAVERRRSGRITQVIRNVLPVLIDAGAPAAPRLQLREITIGRLAGTTRSAVTLRMENTGLRRCSPQLSVRVRGSKAQAAPVTAQLGTLLPGDEIPYPLLWPSALDGDRYTVTATATGCGGTETLTREIDRSSPPPAVTSDGSSSPTPSSLGTGSAPPRSSSPDASTAGSGPSSGAVPPGVPGPTRPSAVARRAPADGGSVVERAADFVREQAPAVLVRLGPPLLLLILALLFLAAQAAIDRRDPRLLRAPRTAEPDLRFLPAARAGAEPPSIP